MVIEVRKLRDALDMPVDDEILETVVAMRLLGFDTIMSCSGHTDRDTWGPYVVFQSKEADVYASRWKRTRSKTSSMGKNLQNRAIHANAHERLRMHRLLMDFYETHSSYYSETLCVRPLGLSANRLESLNAGIELCLDASSKNDVIGRRQEEMRSFTSYLKKVYFSRT